MANLAYCPYCKRDMSPAFEPPFDLKNDNHVDRCVNYSRTYKRTRTPEEVEVCSDWGRILEDRRRRKEKRDCLKTEDEEYSDYYMEHNPTATDFL